MLIADYGKHQLLPEAKFKDYKRPAEDDSRFDRPSCGMDPGVQDRQPDHLQLRLFRRADRGRPAVQRRLADGQEAAVGCGNLKATNCPEADNSSAKPTARAGRCRALSTQRRRVGIAHRNAPHCGGTCPSYETTLWRAVPAQDEHSPDRRPPCPSFLRACHPHSMAAHGPFRFSRGGGLCRYLEDLLHFLASRGLPLP